jgi:hypothetical protein
MIEVMLKVLAASLAAGAVALAAAGAAAQTAPKSNATPFPLGTLQPFGSTPAPGAAPSLPNIGRTRSVTPACAALRDLVVPSFKAALRADERFTDTRKRLPNYADVVDDPAHAHDAVRQMLLTKLDSDASKLLQEAKIVSDALGDPRLSPDIKDAQIVAERRALQQLYDAQMTRANLLNEFVIREHVASAKEGMEDPGAFGGRTQPLTASQLRRPTNALPAATAPPGMPLRNGIALSDKNTMADWGASLSAYVRSNENAAAKTFIAVGNTCR